MTKRARAKKKDDRGQGGVRKKLGVLRPVSHYGYIRVRDKEENRPEKGKHQQQKEEEDDDDADATAAGAAADDDDEVNNLT